jgi:transcriptional regulator with XRE-family HTH domain
MSPQSHRTAISQAAEQASLRARIGFGAQIRAERMRRRWTLRTLAERAGVSSSAVAFVEAGRPASGATYARLASAMNLRLEIGLVDPRRANGGAPRVADFVHAAMGDTEASHLQALGFEVDLDAPYQHYQFAGRADLVAVDHDRSALLHVENRTRFPDLQEAFGSYNAKRAYLGQELASRLGTKRAWRSETHVMVGLWSAEVIHAVRIRSASFRSVCPDPPDAFAGWWSGQPPERGRVSTFVILDPDPGLENDQRSRRRRFAGLADALRADPRYRGYAEAALALR